MTNKDTKNINGFLDDMLDGKPVWIVDSPELRKALQRRARERMVDRLRDDDIFY